MSKKTDRAYEAILRAFESPNDQFDTFGDDDKNDLDQNFEDNQGGSEDKSWSTNDAEKQRDTVTEDVNLPLDVADADNDDDLENEWDVNTAEKEREEFETGITAQKFDESYREEDLKEINEIFSDSKDYESVFDNTWKEGTSSSDRADDVSGTTDDDENQEIKVGQNQEPNKELGSRRVQLEKSGEGYIMDNTNYYAALEGDGIIAGQADVVDDTHEDAIPASQYGKVVKEKTTWTTEAGTEWQCPECSQTYNQVDDMAAVNHLYNSHGYSEQDAKSVGGYLSEGFAREDLLGIPEEKATNTSDNYSAEPEKLEDEAEKTLGGVVQPATEADPSQWWEKHNTSEQTQILLASGVDERHAGLSWLNLGHENQERIMSEYRPDIGETDAENTDGVYDGITILEDDPLNDQKVEIQNTLALDDIGGYDPQQGFSDDDSGQSINESRRLKKNEKLEHNDLQDLGTEDALGDVDRFDSDGVDTGDDVDQYRGDLHPVNDWKSKTPANSNEYNPDENDILAGRTIEQYLAENNMTREEGEAVARYADMDLRELIQVGNFGEAAYHMEQDNPANWGESKANEESVQDYWDKNRTGWTSGEKPEGYWDKNDTSFNELPDGWKEEVFLTWMDEKGYIDSLPEEETDKMNLMGGDPLSGGNYLGYDKHVTPDQGLYESKTSEVDKEIDKLSTELEHTDQSVIDQKNYYKSPDEWREDLADMRREAGADAGTSAGDEYDMTIEPEAVEDDPDYLSDPDVTGFVDNPFTPNLTGKNKVQHSQFTYDGFNKAEDELNRERGDIDTNNEALEDNTGLNTSSNQAGNVFTCEDCGFKTHNRDEYDNHNKEHGNVPATTETPKGFSEESIAHSNNDYEILSRFS